LNPEWHLCSKGRRQSPIDIRPDQLLFDDQLQPFELSDERVNGVLINNGHSIVFRLDQPITNGRQSGVSEQGSNQIEMEVKMNAEHLLGQVIGQSGQNSLLLGELQTPSLVLSETFGLGTQLRDNQLPDNSFGSLSAHLAGQFAQSGQTTNEASINRLPQSTLSGGPLSYSYTIHSLHLHFGRTDEAGSEHFISGNQFPAEVSPICIKPFLSLFLPFLQKFKKLC
jgi:hypothetical protein